MTELDNIIRLAEGAQAWRRGLIVSNAGLPHANVANALTALRGAPEWRGVLAYNEFTLTVWMTQPPPWRAATDSWAPARWTDSEDVLAAEWLQHQGINVSPPTVAPAVVAAAKDAPYHPVRDYLAGLEWDGRNRLEGVAATCLGAADSGYAVVVGKCML